ncbi:MAG TPA: RpiB/LacA/LacB family sugar-phosphate isomerase, partial [Syntrophales bacterium]|nr:RpiB/LacA/LacB family sugar-phosphate isomerase [Syntrophales bacterium]
GVGMAIAANKVPGIRAVVALNVETARLSRAHNDTNVLALAGRMTGVEEARRIVETWLETAFEGGRHNQRLDKIRKMERE